MAAIPGRLMLLLQPADVGRNRRRGRFDPPVIAFEYWDGNCRLALWIIEQLPDIVVQRAFISLQRQRIVAHLLPDLLGDGVLAVERVGGHDSAFQHQHGQRLWHFRDFVRLGADGQPRQHQKLFAASGADHMQGRLATGPIERTVQNFPIGGHNLSALH